ncbi:hypothetical protein O6H91_13G066900 [Diphasiastrum complanatum]|nr:hypothetical protein O6H91_13G066900 [Diphasiastrum complanatum]
MQTCNQVLSSGHMFNEKLESSSTSLPFICKEAVWHPNIHSFEKQLLRTSSMELLNKRRPLINKPQFRVIPEAIFFKQVPVGSTAIQAVTLFNFNHDMSRFRVESNMDCLKFYYQHGMVAPGMNRVLKVHFVAPEVGKFVGKVEIKTRSDNLSILVLAEVINP